MTRVLLLHNFYKEKGGEDVVLDQEASLLRSRGHDVRILSADNKSILTLKDKLVAAGSAVFSQDALRRVDKELSSFCPDVVHVHNFFPMLSPSVYYACTQAKVPVIQTLHNFRTICPSALLYRNGQICEKCLDRTTPWPAIRNKCYRDSVLGSTSLVGMISIHRALGTWNERVSAYIALTEFAKQKFVQAGFPEQKLFCKPNFLHPDPGPGRHEGDFALFVGRLSPEKGLRTLIAATKLLGPRYNIKIVGSGPLYEEALSSTVDSPNVELLGQLSRDKVRDLLGSAKIIVFPSECYEGFPMVLVEAFARGLPVIASRLGSAAEIVDETTGIFFSPGNAAELAESLMWAFTHERQLRQLSTAARRQFESLYTSEENYRRLMEIYQAASQDTRSNIQQQRGAAGSASFQARA